MLGVRVVIIADAPVAADELRRCLRYAPSLRIVGCLDGRRPCAYGVHEARPDVIVIDDMAAARGTLVRIAEIRDAAPAARIVLLTRTMDAAWLGEACEAGIHAAIARSVGGTDLGTLVRQIAGGVVFHAFAPTPAVAAPGLSALTARELQILRLVAGGASNGRVAAQLCVTEQTVKFHLSNTYRKLGVANRTEAGHRAHVHGLFGPSLVPVADEPPTPRPVAA